MKTSISAKNITKRLIRKFGSVEAAAIELRVSTRYVEMLRDGHKRAGWALAELIKFKLGD